MANKKVAFFPEDMNDLVVSFDSETFTDPIEAKTLPESDDRFWIEDNPDGVPALCVEIATASASMVLQNSQGTYPLTSADFVGGRPPRKPR